MPPPPDSEHEEFYRIRRLPPYVFGIVDKLKKEARRSGKDIVDFGMGNPDQPTPRHIVDKLIEAAPEPKNHRYSMSRGLPKLRGAICDWYARRFGVSLDPETEAIATIGSKEGLAHLLFAITAPGDVVLVPNPCYPIHAYGVILAGGEVCNVPIGPGRDFFADLESAYKRTWPRPKLLLLNFPHNPTTAVVDLDFFTRVVAFARDKKMWVVQDLAYADIVFDGYVAPSILQVPGAKELAVEFFTLSKSYNMPGWRAGFCVGNPTLIHALGRIKSYLDYGTFQPLQIASIVALNGPQDCVGEICDTYRVRRDVLCEGLERIGWQVPPPKATMFVWAEIPEKYRAEGSLAFAERCIKECDVAVSPGIGFGDWGDGHVRFALIENEQRSRQAIRGLRRLF